MTEGSNAIGRRYVPKGGYIVDFESRTTPKMRYLMRMRGDAEGLLSGQQEGAGTECRAEDGESGCISERAMVVWHGPENSLQRVEPSRYMHAPSCTKDHGRDLHARPEQAHAWTGSMHDGSPKSSMYSTSYHGSTNQSRSLEINVRPKKGLGKEAGTTRRLRCEKTEAVSKGQIKHGNVNAACWKPAGPVRQIMNINYSKRPIKRRTGKALTRGIETLQNAHDCETCPCCSTLRNQLNEQIKENHRIAETLKNKKTSLDSSISKLDREKKEFEMFKEQQMIEFKRAQEESKRKTERDRLARASEARYASKDTEAKLRMNLSKVQSELGLIKEKLTGEVEKYKQEVGRILQQKKSLQAEVKELKRSLAEAKIHLGTPSPQSRSPSRQAFQDTRQEDLGTPKRGMCPPKKSSVHQRNQEDLQCGETDEQTVSKTTYENGTERTSWQGYACYEYTNGDIRQEYPSGVVEYFYESLGCWHVAHTSGEDVYYFEDGRREAHLSNDVIQISLQGNPSAYSCINGSTELHPIPLSDVNALLLCPCPTKLNIQAIAKGTAAVPLSYKQQHSIIMQPTAQH